MNASRLIPLALLVALGCSPTVRFRDAPPVLAVDDTSSIAEPSEREFLPVSYFSDLLAFERLDRTLRLRTLTPAQDTNALDEVPDSSWFQNRIGVREVTPAEAARGSDGGGPPKLPLVVVRGKTGGGNPGFIVKDASGRSFLIKFDPKHDHEVQTSAGVVTNRFFWTIGYNVPADHVFTFRRSDLTIKPGATHADAIGRKIPFTDEDLEGVLATAPEVPAPEGGRPGEGPARTFRALGSLLLEGKPKGGWAAQGTRPDDPNDRIAHEHRRVLRGLRVFAAWLDHTDMKEDNSLDMYVHENGRHFLRHYLVDFGESLGGHAAEKGRLEDGYENVWDWGDQPKALVTLGLWRRPWEGRGLSPFRSLGPITTDLFDPTAWREAYPYWPFLEMDASDASWGARIVARFSRAHVEAIVDAAQLTDPAARRYLVEALMIRRERILQAFLEPLTPLGEFTVEGRLLCASDLAARAGISREGIVDRLDEDGKVDESRVVGPDARVCVHLPGGDYVTTRLRLRRGHETRRPLQVHVRGDHVVGLVRLER